MATAVFISLAVLLGLGIPIAISLGIASTIGLYLFTNIPMMTISQKLFTNLESFPLMAVPFFVLAGNIFNTGGVAGRLIGLTNAWVGHVHGGLAIAGVLGCAMFAAISGSSPATVIAIGGILIPAMIEAGYDKEYAVGVMANAGTLGILIPPSIPMIIYGFVTSQSVGQLFIAGIGPGIMLTAFLVVSCYVIARMRGYERQAPLTCGQRAKATVDALPSLTLPIIIIGGIYGGIFTPTEAAVVACVAGLIIGLFVHREMTWRDMPKVLADSAKSTSMLMLIISMAQVFGYILTTEMIPQRLSEAVLTSSMSWWMVLIVINLILLVAGCFLEPTSIILILGPLFYAVTQPLGINPIHLGIIITMNMEVGMITPPVGLNLYVASGISKMKLGAVARASLPWSLVLLLALAIVTYIPIISLWLPQMIWK
jgi:C4-dicarboxylate transporter DctM subunit